MPAFDPAYCREQFPALAQLHNGRPLVYFDGPGGTQVPRRVIDAVSRYLVEANANHGGAFVTSVRSDAVLHAAREALADFLNAGSADEIAFGANMTSLTFALSRALGRTWKAGDEVVVTRLDHDADVAPWVLAARDAGAIVRTVDFRPEDGTLDLDDFTRLLSARTKLVAVGLASNSLGTINDLRAISARARAAGATVFVDAVHYAPHGPIDVAALGCDLLACSAYKFFGPHVGVLWGRRDLLESLPAYKVRPAADSIPDRWMTGTQNHEGIAGAAAAVEYLAELGARFGNVPATADRRSRLRAAMTAIRAYEQTLSAKFLDVLGAIEGLRVYGITDRRRLAERCPTVSFTMSNLPARKIAEHLAARGICAWDGNFYAVGVTERLGLDRTGGLLRVGAVHYNTAEEIERLGQALREPIV
jgi:cysteine desulfurase family protein (TIGR01976 family)